MNIRELQRKVNEGLIKNGKSPIGDVEFLAAISGLTLKGLVKQVGNELVINTGGSR